MLEQNEELVRQREELHDTISLAREYLQTFTHLSRELCSCRSVSDSKRISIAMDAAFAASQQQVKRFTELHKWICAASLQRPSYQQ
jgi:hypothetical protein